MIEINNLTSISVSKKDLKKIAQKVLKKEKKSLELSIALVGSSEIKKLNKEYRKKDKVTDVLSFLYNGSGEIIICLERVKKDAKELGTTFKKELARILIHGILHLLGEEHEINKWAARKMQKKEDYYLSKI